ncbi:hypothetical protein [Candidatus Amarolinea dominans]|uniref:hypothetical protein n=1 Tax=Candidatus Amarolinea dominans TaxID=3140696 RepID=UPI001D6D76CF|nr:hypothetical protein [Anaerolineae bacterium]
MVPTSPRSAIIGGNAVRNPPFRIDHFRAPAALPGVDRPGDVSPARASAPRESGCRDQPRGAGEPAQRALPGGQPAGARTLSVWDTWQATRDYALQVLPVDPQPIFEADGVQVCRVQAPPPLPFEEMSILAAGTPCPTAATTGMWMKPIWPAPAQFG